MSLLPQCYILPVEGEFHFSFMLNDDRERLFSALQ